MRRGLVGSRMQREFMMGEALMAAARDQAARILRTEPNTAEGDDVSRDAAALGEQLRAHLSDETARRHAEAPASPAIEKPGVDQPAAAPGVPASAATAPKSGKRRRVLTGIVGLLALAAAAYGINYV